MNRPETASSPLHIAVVGGGKHGMHHVQHLDWMKQNPGAESLRPVAPLLLDTADITPPSGIRFVKADLGSYLRYCANQVDAIIIATPDGTHSDLALLAVEAGKHVLIEKPIAVSTLELTVFEEVMRIADGKGLFVSTFLPRNIDPAYDAIIYNLPDWIENQGGLASVHHGFVFQNNTSPNPSCGNDHLAHEIALLMKILGVGESDEISFEEQLDSAESYDLYGTVKGIRFHLSGDKRKKESSAKEFIKFSFNSKVSISIDVRMGAITTISGNRKEVMHINNAYDSNPAIRCAHVTHNFVQAVEGSSELYLPRHVLHASAKYPAQLFPVS